MSVGVVVMAKAKGKRPGRVSEPAEAGPKPALVNIKGNPAWRDWLARVAAADRTSSVELLDRAVAWYAREVLKFPEPPPER